MRTFIFLVLCVKIVTDAVYGEISSNNQDTYLNALHESHQSNPASYNGLSNDYEYGNGHDYPPSSSGYDYQPPQIKPHQTYGPPPQPIYGPPKPIYGPPAPIYKPAFYHPREESWLDKFKFKLDLYTVGKILLKLLIFKKIVKFIGLICLLLFLPKLKNLVKEDDDDSVSMEGRTMSSDKENLNERINEVTNFAITAFNTFAHKYEGCSPDQTWCRFQRMIDVVDERYPYKKIVHLYLPSANIEENEFK